MPVEIPESFTIRLTDDGRKDLALIMERLGVSLGAALSVAIGMYAFLLDAEDAKTNVVLEYNNGERRTLPVRPRGDDAAKLNRYG